VSAVRRGPFRVLGYRALDPADARLDKHEWSRKCTEVAAEAPQHVRGAGLRGKSK
jgi:hypothetical protein